jgi:SPP1 gp7 family putative phage head morphogenesis protein
MAEDRTALPDEYAEVAEGTRGRMLDALRGRALKEALAPMAPTGAANRYAAAMSRYSARVSKLVDKHVLSRLPVAGSGEPLSRFSLEQGLFELRRELDAIVPGYKRNAVAAARAVAVQQRSEVERMLNVSFKRVPGRLEGEAAFLGAWGEHQTNLLLNINAAQVERIRQAIVDYREGESMRASIKDSLWVSRNRAQQVAYNEVHALATDVVAYWGEQAGETEFYWITSRDERVRPGHAVLDERVFLISQPPNTGRREGNNLPGHPPHCRCKMLLRGALTLRRP